MSLFETFAVDIEPIKEFLTTEWGLSLGECLKSSQNQTFKATLDGRSVIVRVTGFSEPKLASIIREVDFLLYVCERNIHTCKPVASLKGEYVIVSQNCIITVFEHASGTPVDFFAYKWVTDTNIVEALGRWLGSLHNVSEQYEIDRPDLAKTIIQYDQLQLDTLAGVKLHEDDVKLMSNPHHYGVLHGDLNYTNFFFDSTNNLPCVYDWDQMHRGWFLYDLTQAIFNVIMLGAGNFLDKSSLPDAAYPRALQNTRLLVKGYEETREGEAKKVCLESLKRMVILRKEQYRRICSRVVEELDGTEDPGAKGMLDYCRYLVDYINSGGADVEFELREL